MSHFDEYPNELKFQIKDAVYNVALNSLKNKSPNWRQALNEYEEKEGWKDKDYDLKKILKNGDWNLTHKDNNGDISWLGVRSAMRRNPFDIDTNDYSKINYNKFRQEMYDKYTKK